MANLGRLGNFKPADDCTDAFSDVYVQANGGTVFAGPVATADCFPDKYDVGLTGYYTGATECPRGYTAACSRVLTQGNERETAVTCCPHPNNATPFECYGDTRETAIEPVGCYSMWSEDEDLVYPVITFMTMVTPGAPIVGKTLTDFLAGSVGAIHAHSIQIRFQEAPETTRTSESKTTTDRSSITDSRSRPTDIPTNTSIPEPTQTPTNEPGDLPEPPPISPGTVAGVTVTTFIIFIVFGVFFFRSTRRKKKDKDTEEQSTKSDDSSSTLSDEEKKKATEMDVPPTWTELEGERSTAELLADTDRPAELLASSKHPQELDAVDKPAELHGIMKPVEMLAETRHRAELMASSKYPAELLANTRHPVELDGEDRATELPASALPVELPAYPYNRYSKDATRASRTWYGRRPDGFF